MPKATRIYTSPRVRAAVLADAREMAQLHGAAWLRHVLTSAGAETLPAIATAVLAFIVAHDADLAPDAGGRSWRTLQEGEA